MTEASITEAFVVFKVTEDNQYVFISVFSTLEKAETCVKQAQLSDWNYNPKERYTVIVRPFE